MSDWKFVLTGTAVSVAVALGGCSSSNKTSSPVPAAPAAVGDADDVEQAYVVGPTAARQLGYRIDFQTHTNPDGDSGIKAISIQGDSVFVLDGHNFLSRLRRTDGQRLWRIPVALPLNEVQGITYMPAIERVFLTVGGDLYELDDNTGSLLDKQELSNMASTWPIEFGGFLIYGARNGQLVWHSWEVGHTWRSYRVAPAMRQNPLIVGDLVVAVGTNGHVMVLDAPSVTGIWSKQLLNGVEAQPVVGGDVLYIAGLDQYLWAIDVNTGRTHWKYLSETPLRTGPVVIDGHVYQVIPGKGLHCFESRPVDMPGGNILWVAEAVEGRVIGRDGERLLVWNGADRTLYTLDGRRGSVIDTVSLPAVSHLDTSRLVDGDLYVASDDGRVLRLVPQVKKQ